SFTGAEYPAALTVSHPVPLALAGVATEQQHRRHPHVLLGPRGRRGETPRSLLQQGLDLSLLLLLPLLVSLVDPGLLRLFGLGRVHRVIETHGPQRRTGLVPRTGF